ncbi:MAG: hypothetical protein U9R25_02595, partial [Chloroflexota bacterium]|nr:hypothetical protein [Chloroflexota bacterium]
RVLPETAQETLQQAAVFGRTFDLDLLAAASELDEVVLLDGLDEIPTRAGGPPGGAPTPPIKEQVSWILSFETAFPTRQVRPSRSVSKRA